jgi:transposase
MAKVFREWSVNQRWLLPPSVMELVPEGHLAHFLRETVRESLDLSAVLESYDEERGKPPYHPVMMTAVLLYAYCQGIYSSRRIAKACEERVDFMAVAAMEKPDFRTIAKFRVRHLAALGGLFTQVLRLCQKAGMVKLGHVALDGTKVKANASKHKAMSYARMNETEAKLAAEVATWFRQANAVDTSEDEQHGADKRGDELPDWVKSKEQRLLKIREAKAALEAEAAAHAIEKKKTGGGGSGSGGDGDPPKPHAKAQRNFTDPESRILKTADGYVQGYNAQLAVDSAHQVIVAESVASAQNDAPELPQMVKQIKANTGRQTRELSADNGYLSEQNIVCLQRHHVRGYIPLGRQKHGTSEASRSSRKPTGPYTIAMGQRLKRGGFRSHYRLRKQIVEPVNGHIKEARGFRRFSMRGLTKVRGEWTLVCIAHNLLKLARFQSPA